MSRSTETERLTPGLLLLMAFACGGSVGNIYYNQPLLDQMRLAFTLTPAQIGWSATLTQVGYALGMLFIVPLGDRIERRKLILIFSFLSAGAALLLASAPTYEILLFASLALGLTTMTPQLLIPFAAQLASVKERGRVVGTLMSGLLLGILLARTISGFIGAAYGWRSMFAVAAAFLVVLTGILAFRLPQSEPTYRGSYFGLLKSVFAITYQQPVLQEAALFGGLLFGSFSAFWATLIFLMQSPEYGLGARAVGLYGIVGAGAALTSPVVGRWLDIYNRRRLTGWTFLLTLLSFGLLYGAIFIPDFRLSLIALGAGVLFMDIGVQSGHISNQSRIFSLLPDSQSRVQTAYMFSYFFGGAVGSLLGTWSWSHYQWGGVCAVGATFMLLALGHITFRKNPGLT